MYILDQLMFHSSAALSSSYKFKLANSFVNQGMLMFEWYGYCRSCLCKILGYREILNAPTRFCKMPGYYIHIYIEREFL